MKRYLALSLLTLTALGCDAMTAHTDVAARVDDHELTVDETVDLLAGNPEIPARMEVVESVVDLWLDYTILAEVAAADSTLTNLDLQSLIQPYVEQQVFTQLREQVVTDDTIIDDAELRELYATNAPGSRVRARHVLITFPDDMSEAQRDSVFALAEEIRERAAGGEDFAELARQYSDDPGSAQQGGNLGWFERGNMVQPFEDAAFALGEGEVSGVVETPFGLHIIKVLEKETPSLEEGGEDFRQQLIDQRRQTSLTAYVDALRADREFEVTDGAQEVARDLSEDPSAPLRGRAADRALVRWDGGELTARELVRVFRRMPAQQRAQYSSLGDEQMGNLLREVATNELVLADADERGIAVPEAEKDSVRTLIRDQLVQMIHDAGLVGSPQEGETPAQAVDRRVRALLDGILSGEQNLLPLGSLPYALREERDWRVYEQAFGQIVERLEARRSGMTEGSTPPAGGMDPEMSDTAG